MTSRGEVSRAPVIPATLILMSEGECVVSRMSTLPLENVQKEVDHGGHLISARLAQPHSLRLSRYHASLNHDGSFIGCSLIYPALKLEAETV